MRRWSSHGTIPGVLAVVEGHSTSPEGLEGGYHYGFIVTFATPQARDAYLNDPKSLPGRRGDRGGRRADCRLRHLTQPGPHLIAKRTDQTPGPAHGSRSANSSACMATRLRAIRRGMD